MKKIKGDGLSNVGKVLLEIFKIAGEIITFPVSEDFFLSRARIRKIASGRGMSEGQYFSTLQHLKRKGYVKTVDENQFLITPKGLRRAKLIKIEHSSWDKKKWNGFWVIVVFDIPEKKRRQRNILRSFLKRKGFFKLQNSVFISPYADFEDLNFVRYEFGIEKYVNFFIAKSAGIDDDKLLKDHFDLH